MAPGPNEKPENGSSLPNGSNNEQDLDGIHDKTNKTARHPRWTREETIILIQGKEVVENRIQRHRRWTLAVGSDQNEPKWDSVSSYCKQHGVNRVPVQCQKRWSNLVGDFKKIKIWESQIKEKVESFWTMRNDLRKEMKLPSYFDKEVYDVLDGVFAVPAIPLTLVTTTNDAKGGEVHQIMTVAEEDKEREAKAGVVSDGSQNTTAEYILFSDFEPSRWQKIGHNPEKETTATQLHISDTVKEKHTGSVCTESTSQERWKQRRLSFNVTEDKNMGDQLIKVLKRNSSMLSAQLEAQNINCQLDREQKKEHSNNLIAAMDKITDALLRIANKL